MFEVPDDVGRLGLTALRQIRHEIDARHAAFVRNRAQLLVGRGEIGAFLQRFVDTGLQMAVEDVLVNGPPWRMRAAVRVRDWVPDPRGGSDRYCNSAVLWVTARWGKILTQEDFEDTERVAAFDALEREQQAPEN